jgi:hypothetical protein
MVRLIPLLFVIGVLYLLAVTNKEIEHEPLGYAPSIITIEELEPRVLDDN